MATIDFYIYLSELATKEHPLGGLVVHFTNKLGSMLVSNEFFSLALDKEYMKYLRTLTRFERSTLCQYLFEYYSAFRHLTNKGNSRLLTKQNTWTGPLAKYGLILVRPRAFLIAVSNAMRDRQAVINKYQSSKSDLERMMEGVFSDSFTDTFSDPDAPVALFQPYRQMDPYPKVCAMLSNLMSKSCDIPMIIDGIHEYTLFLQQSGYNIDRCASIIVMLTNAYIDRTKAEIERRKLLRQRNTLVLPNKEDEEKEKEGSDKKDALNQLAEQRMEERVRQLELDV